MNDLIIRAAKTTDAEQLLSIYAPYVEQTAVTFEYIVPTIEEFSGRMRQILRKYPYLVAEIDGKIVGYAYASAFHTRAAYGWCAETSIYVRMDARGSGIGGALYRKLEEVLHRQGILNLNACIAWNEREDEYLTHASVSFHSRLGYRIVGSFTQCGYKFDRWYDMVWMEKLIGEHSVQASTPQTFDDVRSELNL